MGRYQLFKKIRAIRLFADRVAPDRVWVESVRSTLLMQVKNSLPTQDRQPAIPLKKRLGYLMPKVSWVWVRQPAFIATSLLLALFGGSLLSVSAAERSMPGDVLYSVKLATEQARLALAKDAKEKVKLKSEFTDRRVAEVKQVMASNAADRKERVMQAAEVLKQDMHTLKQQLDEVKQVETPEAVKESAKIVDEKTVSVVQALQESKTDLTPEEKAKVTEAQAAASDTSVKAIEVLADVHAQAADVVTEQDVADALKSHNETVVKTVSETIQNTPTSTAVSLPATTTSTTAAPIMTSTSTPGVKEAVQQATDAQKNLAEADKLVSEQKIDEAVAKLKEGTQQAYDAQKSLEQSVAVSTATVAPTSATPPVATTTATSSQATTSVQTGTTTAR